MAVVLGFANAYLGLKAGMTISATFPAAVIAIAAFRLPFMRGNVLEQNIARTTASVGEALVAGAIFTIPAFVMVEVGGERLWTTFNYWETSLLLLIGGVMGILFVILLRRTLVEDASCLSSSCVAPWWKTPICPFPSPMPATRSSRWGKRGRVAPNTSLARWGWAC
jgi:putative OPT family oligopeptide transporter